MDTLSNLVASMIALSVGVERIVEIFKGIFKSVNNAPAVLIHLLSTALGTSVALAIGPHNLASCFPPSTNGNSLTQIASSVLLGLMASGGSAFWNHVLDIIGAVKKVKETAANALPSARP
jgi:hypothetical protein